MATQRGVPPETVWPVGQVAAMLDVPAVTIRSWERRYGITPTLRSNGRHRRYSRSDVDRLRRMVKLIERGIAPVDAARLSAGRPRAAAAGEVDAMLSAAEQYRAADLAAMVDSRLDSTGAYDTWVELVAPGLQRLGRRFADTGDCTDIEVLLAGVVQAAIERYISRRGLLQMTRRPVLLTFCPDERHTLPMAVLRATLLERSQSAVTLDPGGDDVALLAAVRRARPTAVVLWSAIRRAGQAGLRRRLERLGHPVLPAGPGWPAQLRAVNNLDDALDNLTSVQAVR